MAKKEDIDFEIGFYESVLKRDRVYTEVIELLGGLYTKRGRINDGLKMDRRLVKLLPKNATAHYNLACSLALVKQNAAALKALRKAIDLGYDDADWMKKDPDLVGLKKSKAFQTILADLQLHE